MTRIVPTEPGWWWRRSDDGWEWAIKVWSLACGRLVSVIPGTIHTVPVTDDGAWLAPVLTPAEADALRAERDALRVLVERLRRDLPTYGQIGRPDALMVVLHGDEVYRVAGQAPLDDGYLALVEGGIVPEALVKVVRVAGDPNAPRADLARVTAERDRLAEVVGRLAETCDECGALADGAATISDEVDACYRTLHDAIVGDSTWSDAADALRALLPDEVSDVE